MTKLTKLSLEQLLEVEDKLNEITFFDIPIGGLCAQFLYSNIYFGSYQSTIKKFITNIILNWRERYKIQFLTEKSFTIVSKKKIIIFNISANVKKNFDFFPLLYEEFKDYQCIIVSKEKNPFAIHQSDLYFNYDMLNLKQHVRWTDEFKKINKKLTTTLQSLKNNYNFSYTFIEALKYVITYQTRSVIFFNDFLKNTHSEAVISDFDRHGINAALILAANKLIIPTFTFIHGSTYPPDHYYPVLAKYMICWGDEHKKQFQELGVNNDRLIVCGNQKIDRKILTHTKTIKERFGYREDEKVVLLVTNPIDTDQRLKYAEDFCYSIKANSGLRGIVRIHPSESILSYNIIAKKYPEIIFTDNNSLSFDESMAISDCVISHNSVFGFEALIKRKQVLIYSPPYVTFPLGIGEELNEKAGCELIQTTEGLVEYFKFLKDQKQYTNPKAEAFIDSNIYAFGTTAAHNIYNEIIKRINQ